MSRTQRETQSRGERVDRSRVERDTSKPVRHQEQVISLRNPTVDVSDSTGEDSEGDSTGRQFLQQARQKTRSKSRGKSAGRARARDAGAHEEEEENVGSVRTKYGVKVKVDKVDMDKFADFDNLVRAQTREGRRATREEDMRRTQQSAYATQAQREFMEEQVEKELQELDDIASKRERWLLRNQERQLRAAEASKRQVNAKCVALARMWLGKIRRQGPATPRYTPPGTGAGREDYSSHGVGEPEIVSTFDMTRREDTARQKLYQQNQVEIELYKREIQALADREDEQRRVLKELWNQKAALQAKDEKYTQIVWEVRKHILEHKDEVEKLAKRKDEAERQLDMVYREMEAFREEGQVVKNRRMAALEDINRLKEERAAQEEVEKEQLALLLRMRRAHEMREKRNQEAHVEMERLAAQGQQQQIDYREAENKMLRLEEDMRTMAAGVQEKEQMVQRLVEQKREREREEQQHVHKVQLALADLDEQDKRIQAHRNKVNALRDQMEDGVRLEAEARAEMQVMERLLADPERVRRKEEAEAKMAGIKAQRLNVDNSVRELQQQLEVATLALREAELEAKQVREQCDEADAAMRSIEERREECRRRTMQMVSDKEAAEARFQKQKDALVSAQHEEKMIEKREMQVRHDQQKVLARIAARKEMIIEVQDQTQTLDEEAVEMQKKLDVIQEANSELKTRCEVLRNKDVQARTERVSLLKDFEAERATLAHAEEDLARVRENLEQAAAHRAAMQEELKATRKRLSEAYDEQSEKKREIRKREQELDLQNAQLEEQKTKLKDMVERRRAEENAVKAEMNKLRAERQAIDAGQQQWLKEAAALRNEKDAAEKKSKQRAAEIERLNKLKEALDKKEPLQEKELERLNKVILERETKESERYKEIKRLREEIERAHKELGDDRSTLQELQRKKAELLGELQLCSEDTGMTEAHIELLEMKLRNLNTKSDDFRVQKEALDHNIADASREGEMLQKQLREAEALRDSQIKALEKMTRTLAHAQADLSQRTEELRKTNENKAEVELHLRAEYDRQVERVKDLDGRAHELQASLDRITSEIAERAVQVDEVESSLKEKEDAASDGMARLQMMQDRLREAEDKWENVEKLEASGLEKELETKLAAIKEERERLAELREEVADKKREEAMVQDEIARDFRCKVDTEKQLERSRKDLHEMRAKLAPLLKEQLAAEEEVCVLLALLEAANLATLSLHSCSELGAAWAGGLRELLPAAQSSE
jgi:hypothetical protein